MLTPLPVDYEKLTKQSMEYHSFLTPWKVCFSPPQRSSKLYAAYRA